MSYYSNHSPTHEHSNYFQISAILRLELHRYVYMCFYFHRTDYQKNSLYI